MSGAEFHRLRNTTDDRSLVCKRAVMSLQIVRKIAVILWRAVGLCSWCLLGLWTALAAFFTTPVSIWLAAFIALVIAGLYASALRERWTLPGRSGIPWQVPRRSVAALAV